jgi:CRISPR-associated protein Csd2
MQTTPYLDVNRRHDFVLLFDVTDGNPNGDPDAGNLPRTDPETTHGLVTDVAIKRKVRDWVDEARGNEGRFKIYVQRESYLTETRARVFGRRADGRKDVPPAEARQWMCEEFYDIRMFGAVMSMKENNAGQVRGPVQLTFARSADPISYLDISIARVALERGEKPATPEDDIAAPTHGTLGRKAIVPYGLYRAHGFFNPHFARQTGVTSEDLELFWAV